MRKAAGGQEGRHVLCKEWDWFRVDSGAAGFEHMEKGKKASSRRTWWEGEAGEAWGRYSGAGELSTVSKPSPCDGKAGAGKGATGPGLRKETAGAGSGEPVKITEQEEPKWNFRLGKHMPWRWGRSSKAQRRGAWVRQGDKEQNPAGGMQRRRGGREEGDRWHRCPGGALG